MNKKEDEIYCPECGKAIKKKAIVCPFCGVQVKKIEIIPAKIEPEIIPKSKIIAIVLAVFFSFWSWLYTYGRNKRKFWFVWGIALAILLFTISYSCSIIASENVGFFGSTVFIWPVYILGIWLWSIIDNAIKPRSFYENYPNG